MSLSKHPNVLRVRGTWVDGHKLYIAMRLMNKGRCVAELCPSYVMNSNSLAVPPMLCVMHGRAAWKKKS